jgi:hypothetical protein
LIGHRHPDLTATLPLFCFEEPRTWHDRVVHRLAFTNTYLGDVLASLLMGFLKLLERARLRTPWRKLCGGLRHYWYLRGAAEQLGSQKAFAKFFQCGSRHAEHNGLEIEIDLSEGIEAAERRLTEVRPAGVRVRYGHRFVGRVPPQAGSERLSGTHLRAVLAADLAWPFLRARLLQSVLTMASTTTEFLTMTSQSGSDSLRGTNVSEGIRSRTF